MNYNYYNNVRVPKYAVRRYKQSDEIADIVAKSIPIFHSLLDFNEDIIITLKPRRGNTKAIYDPNLDEVEADLRYGDSFGVLSLVAHELVHAEQYKQERLDSFWANGGYIYRWHDTYTYITEEGYNTYIPPWEAEAYERQDGLALVVYSELGF